MLPLNLPSIVDEVARQEALVGAFLAAAGLMFMILGIRLSRLLIGLSFGVVGFVLGGSMGGPEDVRIALGMVVALALAIPSLWATRPAVAVLSGMWAALATILLLDRLGVDDQVTLVAAAVIFAGAASMVFVSMKEMVAVVTSLEGTLLFLAGLIVLVNQNPLVWAHMRNMLVRNPIFAPFLVLSGTIIGFYLQIAEFQKKQAGQSA